MIKDLSDSKRINNQCHTQTVLTDVDDYALDATIVSYIYWPPFREEKLELPPEIKEYFIPIPCNLVTRKIQKYAKAYEGLKPTRQLTWKPNLGTVDIELEFAHKTLSFSLSPVQATIVMLFQDTGTPLFNSTYLKDTWTLTDIASKINLPKDVTKKRLAFWTNHGVIKEVDKNVYQLSSEAPTDTNDQGMME